MATSLTTGRVRISFPHLMKPYARDGQEPKYSVTILLPKNDTATKNAIDLAVKEAYEQGVAKKWGGKRPAKPAVPIYDGDGVRPNGEAFGEECKGHYVFTANSKNPPAIVDSRVHPITDASQIYSGMYCKVGINFFPYDAAGRKGIGCGLNGVQKVADGESLGGSAPSVDQMFKEEPDIDPVTGEAYTDSVVTFQE